jgi:hypothetical protein
MANLKKSLITGAFIALAAFAIARGYQAQKAGPAPKPVVSYAAAHKGTIYGGMGDAKEGINYNISNISSGSPIAKLEAKLKDITASARLSSKTRSQSYDFSTQLGSRTALGAKQRYANGKDITSLFCEYKPAKMFDKIRVTGIKVDGIDEYINLHGDKTFYFLGMPIRFRSGINLDKKGLKPYINLF